MPIFEILGLSLGALAVWLWLDSVKAREIAVAAALAACAQDALQLLDETVAIRKLWLARDSEGRLRLLREYGFEFSETGDNRRSGRLTLIGHELEMLHLRPRLCLVETPEVDRD
ncbi:MAG: DUF3301 domain-containing protein [Betaproteobacteria bacterium]